ncbi:reverse transcriptase domain-containing protein [Tanacetum coccineum]
MCDASDFAVGFVLGQRIEGKFKPIYYASKTLNNAQEHYTTTKKELLAVVFSFDKFRPYLILSKTVVYTDHSALKYLFRAENLVADHLSRLENPDLGTFTEEEIADKFPDEHLMILKTKLNEDEPWYVDYDEPYAFKLCPNNIMRRCIAGGEIREILSHCHSGPTGGHHTAAKNRFIELNELMELRDGAYENTQIYKERTKRRHDSRFKMHPGKLKSRWYELNVVKIVYSYGTIKIIDRKGISFKVNGQRLKKYHDGHTDADDKEVVEFEQDTM